MIEEELEDVVRRNIDEMQKLCDRADKRRWWPWRRSYFTRRQNRRWDELQAGAEQAKSRLQAIERSKEIMREIDGL